MQAMHLKAVPAGLVVHSLLAMHCNHQLWCWWQQRWLCCRPWQAC